MFPGWDFAEAMFSRWAIKRVCKFLLKKRLGELIIGDIDLDNVDIQLTRGTIQLNDLALNVDHLNQKLAGGAVMVKEGSIGSLSVKIPWKLKNCQIELEELEIVLVPYDSGGICKDPVSSLPYNERKEHLHTDSRKPESHTLQENSGPTSIDVHEGVKTIAKIVKWFLTSFHVTLRNLIVAFDPHFGLDGKVSSLYRSLVFRVAEIEYGTRVSEDIATMADPQPASLLGIGRLTNFVKFKGAVVEFLSTDALDEDYLPNKDMATSFSEWNRESIHSKSTTRVLGGPDGGGFSGTLNLSIPWKNGSLDIRKVDADISIEPLELSVQSSTINWMILVWDSLKNTGSVVGSQHFDQNLVHSGIHKNLSFPVSSERVASSLTPDEHPVENAYSAVHHQTSVDMMFPQAHVIQNWVPTSAAHEGDIKLEADCGASIDKFFSCFDGMRSSHASSGTNSIWNWTCSVFNAITVASSLASGSGHLPAEQQHIETSIQAAIAGISFVIDFQSDESYSFNDNHGCNIYPGSFDDSVLSEQESDNHLSYLSSMSMDQSISKCTAVHHVLASCQNLTLNLEIYKEKLKFEASITHVKVDEYCRNGFNGGVVGQDYCSKNFCTMIPLCKHLQGKILDCLPRFPFPVSHDSYDSKVDEHNLIHGSGTKQEQRVILFETFGLCSCNYISNSADSDRKLLTSAFFSIKLPPFLFWVHFQLVNKLLYTLKQIDTSFGKINSASILSEGKSSLSHQNTKGLSGTCKPAVTPATRIEVNVTSPCARVLLCFPFKGFGVTGCSSSCDRYVVLDLFKPVDGGKARNAYQDGKASYANGNPCRPSTCVHLDIGKVDAYFIKSDSKHNLDNHLLDAHEQSFTAVQFLAGTAKTAASPSGITIVWQKGLVTGCWMASRAWSLATSHEQRRSRVTGRGKDFSSVTTVGPFEETSSHVRQELILSSEIFLHLEFSNISIHLSQHDYRSLNRLFDDVVDALSIEFCVAESTSEKSILKDKCSAVNSNSCQISFLVECDSLEFYITLDDLMKTTCAMQKELPGPWKKFTLTVEKFELLSVSNIGKVESASLLWLSHGEGELWGAIHGDGFVGSDGFLLSICRNSAKKRGAGDGVNGFSFGTAGSCVTFMSNPQSFQRFTCISVSCATIVAPGGRIDWVNSLCSFFNLASQEIEKSGCGDSSNKFSEDNVACKASSFFLELVDIAVSYLPCGNCQMFSNDIPEILYSSQAEPKEHSGTQDVACLLAAASFCLSNNNNVTDTLRSEYKFLVQDVGLLICEANYPMNHNFDYHVGYLQDAGYVKVAKESLLEAILRIKGDQWEIECSDSRIDLDTCHDTTSGLVQLIAQLQQLYAPDLEDAMLHLQSRWNAVQRAEYNIADDVLGNFDSTAFRKDSEKLIHSDLDYKTSGILEEIIDDAFYMCEPSDTHADIENGVLLGKQMHAEVFSSANGAKLIESYCESEKLPATTPTSEVDLYDENYASKFDMSDCRDHDFRKNGWYSNGSLMILENHIPTQSSQSIGGPAEYDSNCDSDSYSSSLSSKVRGKVTLRNIELRWRMYAGDDWSRSKRISENNTYSNERSADECLEFCISGTNIQYDMFPDEELCISKISLCAQDFNLSDRSKTAPWKLVLGYYNSRDHPRDSSSKAVKLELETVKPDTFTPLEEYRLHLEFLPMRLHLDQSHLNFLVKFFGKGCSVGKSPSLHNNMDEARGGNVSLSNQAIVEEAFLPFFQKCVIRPIVLRIDYIPHHIDLAALGGGNYAELLNLVPWKGIELQLKNVCAVGVYGWSSICETVFGEWLEDLSQNQIHKLLKGLAPIRSLVAVSSAASKLVSLPVKSYKRERKLLKGMQRGAIAFVKSISVEAVGLGIHFAAGAHDILLQTEYVLTSIPPSLRERNRSKASIKFNQPKDLHEGIQQARESLSDGINRTASALVAMPVKVYQRGAGAGSALATAARAAPVAAIAPISASAHAMHCALVGFRNSLDPDHKRDSMEKYLGPSYQRRKE